MLEQCIDVFRQLDATELADQLAAALTQVPLPVPADFKAGEGALMYRLSLVPELRQQGLRLMQQAVELALHTPQTRHRGLGGFVAVWREYADHHEHTVSDNDTG